jgi:ABC-2 type transport system permease protein
MVRRLASMLRKELIQVFRNEITLRMVLLVPIVQLILFGYVAILDVRDIPTAVIDHSKSFHGRTLLGDFENSGYFKIIRYLESEKGIGALLDRGEVDLVIVIPEDFSVRVANGEPTEVMGAIDASDSNNAITVGNYFVGITTRFAVNVATRIAGNDLRELKLPFEDRTRVFFNPTMESIYYLVPGIIAVMVIMLLVLLSAISIVREREYGTLEQLMVTPIRVTELVIGKSLPFMVIGYVVILLITVVGTLWFNVPIKGNFFLLMLLSGLYMLAALGLGMLASSFAQTQQQAMMLAFFFIIPQILLSGFIFPIESMPEILQWFTYVIPARYFLIIIRGIFLKGVGITDLLPETISLAILALCIFTVAIFRFSRRLEI